VASLKIGYFESHLASESLTFKKKEKTSPDQLGVVARWFKDSES